MDNPNEPYRTSDLYFAAYLKVAGVELQGTMRDEKEKKRVWFLFDRSGPVAIRDLKNEYFNRKSKVAALDYVNEIQVMKHLTHETD